MSIKIFSCGIVLVFKSLALHWHIYTYFKLHTPSLLRYLFKIIAGEFFQEVDLTIVHVMDADKGSTNQWKFFLLSRSADVCG